MYTCTNVFMYSGTSEKDSLNKGRLCMRDTFQSTNPHRADGFFLLKEDNLSIMDKMIRPNVSVLFRGSTVEVSVSVLAIR